MQLMSIKIGLLSVLLLKTCVQTKGGLGGFAPQTLTRSYYFEPPLSKKRSRATDYETKFIKLAKISIAEFLSKLFNLCLTRGVFPEALKIAEVVPIYKKGNVCEPTNYRPISLLSQFSKIFEKLLFNRVIEYLEKFRLLSTRQYGFRKNSSTIHAIADIHNNLMTTADKRLYNCCLFLDLSKAFNTVDHKILLWKLERYFGFRGPSLNLFRDYLNNRF